MTAVTRLKLIFCLMVNVERDSTTAIAALLAAVLLPVWFTVLVFVASSGVDDAPSEGTPVVIAIVCFLAIPYGLACRFIVYPMFGQLPKLCTSPYSSFVAILLTTVVVVVLVASSILGLDALGLTVAWQIIPYLAILVFVPPLAAGFIAYCFLNRASAPASNRG